MQIEIASLVLLVAASGTPAEVQLQSRDVHLSDLAVVSDGQSNPVIARVPRGTIRLALDEDQARRLIRNRLPMNHVELRFEESVTLVAPTHASMRHLGTCFAAANRVVKGQFISASLVEPTTCEGRRSNAKVGYDRDARAPVATDEIAAGTYLGPISPITDRRIAKDADVLLTIDAGPVTITRSVTTLQAGQEGRNVVIQTVDGKVFTVPVSHLSEDLAQ
ncbi:MAG: hypothetical protein ABJK59_11175 [Erythrobacter sp.]|uniref:hypothetical protein n=1 Tax=Erythrobacter sp. TaxID=1042 RepID=UPI00329A5298